MPPYGYAGYYQPWKAKDKTGNIDFWNLSPPELIIIGKRNEHLFSNEKS